MIVLTLFMSSISLGFRSEGLVWQRISQGISESDIHTLVLNSHNNQCLYAGTSRAVYKSHDGGRNWTMSLRLKQEKANDIYIPHQRPQEVYVATDAGLYASYNEGKTWQRIYSASDPLSKRCLSILQDKDILYLGTAQGLYYKGVGETAWQHNSAVFHQEPVYRMAQDEDFVYFVGPGALIRLDKETKSIQKIFSSGSVFVAPEEETVDEELWEEAGEKKFIKAIEIGRDKPFRIFLATSGGIYSSDDHGDNWHKFSFNSLPLRYVTSLQIIETSPASHGRCQESPKMCWGLLAGTKRGTFFLEEGRWAQVYQGMETNGIQDLAWSSQGEIYAATDRGVYYLPYGKSLPLFEFKGDEANQNETALRTKSETSLNSSGDYREWAKYFSEEPSIQEVHRWAIEYAEVAPEKIREWRRLARKRAYLPQMDIGADSGKSWGTSDNVWGSYTGGGQHYIGPDDKSWGEDFGWDVSLSWDLGDLIWNTDQTTIDSRSKLMVELRESILDQVTRLYFERRRIQLALMAGTIEDPQIMLDQQMRLEELTALIDAYTGGEFSKRLQQV